MSADLFVTAYRGQFVMRIAFFHSSLPRPGEKPGGVTATVHRLANTLVCRGHDVAFYAYAERPADARYELRQLATPDEAPGRLGRFTSVPARLNRVNFSDAEVLHLHGDDWFFLRRRLPTVRTFYGAALQEGIHAARQRRWARAALQGLLTPLEALSSGLATSAYGIAPGGPRVHLNDGYLPCGVDVHDVPARNPSAHPSILFVGTWLGRKRGKLLYDAFKETVLQAYPSAELWMVSDWAPQELSVRWFPAPSDAELASLRSRAWAFCLPSSYEGFGIPYIEAMAAGLPAVATPNVGANFVSDGGRAMAVVDPERLGSELRSLLGDATRREALATAGLARAGTFSWERVADAHEAAYARAIERFSSPAR
jgi:glycosyltransferase involved in cell wall biosynthesis